jgi:hypothetical protein
MQMLHVAVMLYKKRGSVVLDVQTKCCYVVVGEWGRLNCGVALEIVLQISISSRGARQCKNRPTALSEFHITCILDFDGRPTYTTTTYK